MARQTVAETTSPRESGYLYFIKKGDIWSAPLKKPGQPKGKQTKVASPGVELDYSKYMYFVGTKGGNLIVERTERQVGGSKRAKSAKKKSGGKKGGAKKTAKKSSAKKGGKKGKKR